jgi:hypothetical protein
MARIPDDSITRRFEQPMKRNRELDHAERGTEVATRGGDRFDDLLADLIGQLSQLRVAQPTQVGRAPERRKDSQGSMLPFGRWVTRAMSALARIFARAAFQDV